MVATPQTEPRSGSVDNSVPDRTPVRTPRSIYSGVFWAAYAANVTVVSANALAFRFAELVGFVGGSEQTAGMIIGVAMGIALFARLFLGQAIDRHGVRRLWLTAGVLLTSGGMLLTLTSDLSWQIYVARTLFSIGLAGALTCSTVHIQSLVRPERRTEIIASLGSSGFVGMILGALLGDLIFLQLEGRTRFLVLFGGATLLGALYIGFVAFITRGDHHQRPRLTPALHHLLFRYWPGNVLSVAFVMGMTLAVTTVFLTRFATHHGMSGIGPFFMGYAISAFIFRIASRGWSRTIGRHRMILMGLVGHTAAMFMLPFATTTLLIMVPAVFGGFGHALLFPAVVSLGSEAFPRKFRGTGTTVVMGFFELGVVVSAPILGTIIDAFDGHGFTPMFLFAGSVTVIVGVVYLLTTARTSDADLLIGNRISAGKNVAIGPQGSGPFLVRHSPIEPAAPAHSTAKSLVGESSANERFVAEPIVDEKGTIRPAVGDRPPQRKESATGIPPATRCR